ncbi:hypothetical protein [Patulibacter sp.]|uniref:Vgb family protein n=1 Tax=Patulibacter sp. TaxID=1912859 RepID=UPI0027205BEE|nr:hypothetical protein [Patulibacter sp.]MDO9407777.1 hypothetical protein [Patulibacter sp.]
MRVHTWAVAAATVVGAPVALSLVGAGAASAASAQEFQIAGATGPRDLVAGPGGALWVTADGALVRVATDGAASRLTAGISPGARPYAIASGPGGTLWFTEDDEDTGNGDGVLGRVAADGAISELPSDTLSSPAGLRDVVAGPNGTAAFVGGNEGGLGIYSEGLNEDEETVFSYDFTPVPEDANIGVTSIALGPDKRYWYTASDFTGAVGVATFGPRKDDYEASFEAEYQLPAAVEEGSPEDIVAGPDNAMWFTLPFASAIGRVDVATGAITTYPTPAGSAPTGITRGPDGALWFTDTGVAPGIGRINPITKSILMRTDGLSPGAAPRRITPGPDGALWYADPGVDRVGRVDPVAFLAGPAGTDEAPADPGPAAPPIAPVDTPAPTVPAPTPATPAVPATPTTPKPPKTPAEKPQAVFSRFSYGVRVRAPRRARVSFRLSRAATVQVVVDGAATRSIASVSRSGRSFKAVAGMNRLTLPKLVPGRHVVRLRATTADGRVSTLRARVRVLEARQAAPSFTG